ncbi:MAG: lysophospholipid acyltransferase family protein [Acidimicrobiia bacterium]|nr:lysophospholipid acyltransferase family protein [Acidimicrobiia bacterium]
MRWFWQRLLRLGGWKTAGEVPPLDKMVIIGAPHTSNWDFPIGMLAARALGVKIRFLGKHTLFRPPFGWFFRLLGGIPVDRSRPGGIIDQIREAFASSERLTMVLAPEGTRSHRQYWKSGFYEIARAAGVPIVLARIDAERREVRVGPTIEATGDVTADMDRIRPFYDGIRGIKPEKAGPVRLKAEEE